VSLADYRGKSPVLLAINRGLWCSFCRRYIVQLGGARDRLQQLGVETLAVVASDPKRASLYVRHRPARVPLVADPDLLTHRAYGLETSPVTPEIKQAWEKMQFRLDEVAVSPTDLSELTASLRATQKDPTSGTERLIPFRDFVAITRRLYPYEMTQSDQQHRTPNGALWTGQFLVDWDGVVRWTKVQRATRPPAGLGNYPSEEELVVAALALSRA
jgi:AhpC/TSA family